MKSEAVIKLVTENPKAKCFFCASWDVNNLVCKKGLSLPCERRNFDPKNGGNGSMVPA